MSKRKPTYRGGVRTRESIPRFVDDKGTKQLACPFCIPTHVLIPGRDSACGTTLTITAVQQIITSRIVRSEELICVRCGQGDGEMVQYMGGFAHVEDCKPGTVLFSEPPRFSRLAAFVYRLPRRVQGALTRFYGSAQPIQEVDPKGNRTGNVLGYVFLKGS